MTYIPVILGTARDGRWSEHVAHFVNAELVAREGIESDTIDPRDYVGSATVPAWEDSKILQPWRDIVTKADGFVLVVPEYNHGYPGELKMLLDGAFKEYDGKPIAICGVSTGGLGGVRAVENIKPVLNALGLVMTKGAMYFSNVETLFEKGMIVEAEKETNQKRLGRLVDELLMYVKALKK